jgi:hypothetical protein
MRVPCGEPVTFAVYGWKRTSCYFAGTGIMAGFRRLPQTIVSGSGATSRERLRRRHCRPSSDASARHPPMESGERAAPAPEQWRPNPVPAGRASRRPRRGAKNPRRCVRRALPDAHPYRRGVRAYRSADSNGHAFSRLRPAGSGSAHPASPAFSNASRPRPGRPWPATGFPARGTAARR